MNPLGWIAAGALRGIRRIGGNALPGSMAAKVYEGRLIGVNFLDRAEAAPVRIHLPAATAPLLPPSWVTRSVPEDGGFTHEKSTTASPWRAAGTVMAPTCTPPR